MNTNDNYNLGQHIQALAKGNISALDLIFVHTKEIMKAVALGRLNNNEEAEDIVQDAYVVIVKKADRFKNNNNAIGWILKIVDNLAKNKLKRNKYYIFVSNTTDVPDEKISAEDKLLIKQVLDSLNEYERFLIYYKYWCDFSLSEIGHLVKKPKTTVAAQIQKLEEKIKKF